MNDQTSSLRIDLSREPPFALGDVEVRPAKREIVANGAREILEPRVMQVLTALAHRRGEIVTRDELIAMCWENRAVGDDAINRCTGRLRRLAETFGGFTIETIPRVGYRLDATAVSAATEAVAGPVEYSRVNRRMHPRFVAVLVLAVLAVVGLAWWSLRGPAKEVIVRAPLAHRIAVLPFTPQSADAEARLFGDRVASTVTEVLSKIGQPVIPPAASFQYRGVAKARAARELRAMYVIDGEVVREAGRVRVSVHFDDAVHGTTVFSNVFEETIERAGALPDRVATYIAAVTWGSDITHWSEKSAPAMLRAFEQQKRGDYFAAYETAKAVAAADPDSAEVQRLYAYDVVNLIFASEAARTEKLIDEAQRAARTALRLRPDLSEAHGVFASTTPHYLWAEREAHIRKALSRTPNSIGMAEYLAWLLIDTGRFRDAEPSARSAFERFPYHVNSQQRRIEQLLGAGQAASALALLPGARRIWPNESVFLDLQFEALVFQQSPADAAPFLRDSDIVTEIPAAKVAHWNRVARALATRTAADVATLSQDCTAPGDFWWSCMVAFSKLDRLDEAFRIARQAYTDQRAAGRAALVRKWLANPELPTTRYLFIQATTAMRADPRFRDIAERVGLLPYWRAQGRRPDFCITEQAPVCRELG